MAMIQCPECKKEISDLASFCPHCGRPRQVVRASKTRSSLSGSILTVLIIGVIAALGLSSRPLMQSVTSFFRTLPGKFALKSSVAPASSHESEAIAAEAEPPDGKEKGVFVSFDLKKAHEGIATIKVVPKNQKGKPAQADAKEGDDPKESEGQNLKFLVKDLFLIKSVAAMTPGDCVHFSAGDTQTARLKKGKRRRRRPCRNWII